MLIMRRQGMGDYTAAQPGGASFAPSGDTAYNPGTSPPGGGASFAPAPSIVTTSNAFAPGGGGAAFAPVPTAENTGIVESRGPRPRDQPVDVSAVREYQAKRAAEEAAKAAGKGKGSVWPWVLGAAAVAGGYYWWSNR
jgi:hypothetical protein